MAFGRLDPPEFFELSNINAIIIKLLAPHTPILADFWIFSDQAQLLDPESAASKEPRSGLVA